MKEIGLQFDWDLLCWFLFILYLEKEVNVDFCGAQCKSNNWHKLRFGFGQ